MFKLFLLYLVFTISYQQKCSTFKNDPLCGGHNTDYKLKCQKFDTNSNCVTVEVDDYCKLNSATECVNEANIPSGEVCFNFGQNNKCKRIKVDNNCEIINTFPYCQKKSTNTNTNKKCEFDYYNKYCQELDKICSDYSDENCGNIGTKNGIQCTKLSTEGNCQEIIVDDYCEINNDYQCEKK